MRRSALALLALGLGGCTSAGGGGPWLLPPAPAPDRVDAGPPASIAVLGSAAATTAGAVWTPRSGPLELGHVLRSVHESYPLLTVARQEQVLAEARQLSALGAFDLRLQGGASWDAEGFYENHTARVGLEQQTGLWGLKVWSGYRLGLGDFDPTFDGKRVTNHGGELSAGASLPLLRGGSIDGARRELRRSAIAREIAGSEIALRRVRFEREAAAAYWRWAAAGQRLNVAEALLTLAEERQDGIARRVGRGDLPEIEGIDNERLVVRRRTLQVAARRQLEKGTIALSLFLRTPDGQPLRAPATALPQRLPDPNPPDPGALSADLEAAFRGRPDLRRLTGRQGSAQIEQEYAENQLLPQLDLKLSASRDLDARDPSPTKGEFELRAGLELSFPLQNRRARGRLMAARAGLARLAAQERFLRDTIEAEVRDALSALQAAYERVRQATSAADLARRVAAAERRRFSLGAATVLQMNLREEATAEAELGLIAARVGYWEAVAAYRAAMGISLTEA